MNQRPGNAKKAQQEAATKAHIFRLVQTYQGIQQRNLCAHIGACIHYVKKLVDQLILEGRLERVKSNGIITLYTGGYRASRPCVDLEEVQKPKPWNACRYYRITDGSVLRYRDLSEKIPVEYAQEKAEAQAG
jgi:hypothetical protein